MKWPALLLLASICCVTPRSATSQTSEGQLEQSFRAGQDAMRRGEFAAAAEKFKKVLALDPNLPEAEINLGLAYQSLFEYDLAISHLTKGLRERPSLVGPTVIVGMDYLKLGSPDKAIPFLQRALKLDPSNREAHEAMTLYYLGRNDFQSAAEEFRQLAALNSDKAEAWFRLGHQYLDLSARLAFRGARLYKDSPWGHRFLGDLLFERGRWEDASQEYRKALAIDSKQSGLHRSLGEAYLRAGKLAEAETEFRQELELDSRNERAWLSLASLHLVKGQALPALESVGKAWEISPEFLQLQHDFPSIELTQQVVKTSTSQLLDQPEGAAKHFLLAGLYAATNDNIQSDREWRSFHDNFSQWQRSFNLPANENPCKAHFYSRCADLLKNGGQLGDSSQLLLGKTYLTLRQYEPAAGALSKVRGDTNENVEASYWLERTYQALGADAYARLEDSFPDSWRTHQLRAEGHAIRRDLDNAIKEYQLALQLRPDEAELHEALGEFYLDNHSDGEALGELEKTVSLDPSRTKALYLLGRLHVQNRENEKAIPYLQRALRLQPNLNEASGLMGTAYVRMGKFAEAIPKLEKAASLDHFGNIHYQLSLAYRKLGQMELAQKALARSQDLRRSSLERDQALIIGSSQVEAEPQ
jgi:tetratricopeptide (TPR) repeat protein